MRCKFGHEVVMLPSKLRGTKPSCSTVWHIRLRCGRKAPWLTRLVGPDKLPRQNLGRGRQKSISHEYALFQKSTYASPETLSQPISPLNTLAWWGEQMAAEYGGKTGRDA